MGWSEPGSIHAECDLCGRFDTIDGDSSTSGHWVYPSPDEVGWGYGEDGQMLCPDCLEQHGPREEESE